MFHVQVLGLGLGLDGQVLGLGLGDQVLGLGLGGQVLGLGLGLAYCGLDSKSANDTQVYISTPAGDAEAAVRRLTACLVDIEARLKASRLRLNPM